MSVCVGYIKIVRVCVRARVCARVYISGVLWENVFSIANTSLPALDRGIGTVCYHGDWPHNGYHGNIRGSNAAVVKETERLREERRL